MDNAHQTQMQPTSLRAICQSGALHLLESYTAKRYALNMNFFASINPKLFEELKSPPAQYNVYCNGKDLNIIDVHTKNFVYPTRKKGKNLKHTMIEQNFALSSNPLNNSAYTLHTNRLALHKLDEEKLPLTAGICNPMIDMMLNEFGGANRFHLPSHFLPNMTLFGLLGGMFLQFLIEQGYYFHSLLLFEEHIDFFRISLYFVDYPCYLSV